MTDDFPSQLVARGFGPGTCANEPVPISDSCGSGGIGGEDPFAATCPTVSSTGCVGGTSGLTINAANGGQIEVEIPPDCTAMFAHGQFTTSAPGDLK